MTAGADCELIFHLTANGGLYTDVQPTTTAGISTPWCFAGTPPPPPPHQPLVSPFSEYFQDVLLKLHRPDSQDTHALAVGPAAFGGRRPGSKPGPRIIYQ